LLIAALGLNVIPQNAHDSPMIKFSPPCNEAKFSGFHPGADNRFSQEQIFL
jgi:hypothetical protein